jgi:hypothetical protein
MKGNVYCPVSIRPITSQVGNENLALVRQDSFLNEIRVGIALIKWLLNGMGVIEVIVGRIKAVVFAYNTVSITT